MGEVSRVARVARIAGVAGVAGAIAVGAAGTARADDVAASAWSSPHLAIAANAGIGGPLGLAGVDGEIAPNGSVSVTFGYGTNRGLGASLGGASSHSLAASVHGNLPVAPGWVLTGGVGASRSNWDVEDHPFGESPYGEATWEAVTWLDVDVGIERRWRHVAVRAYAGHSSVLAKHGYRCQDSRDSGGECPYMMGSPSSTGFVGVSVAYAFAL